MARAIAVAGAAVLGIIAVLIGLVAVTVAVILAFYDTDDLKHLAAGAASTALGREVAINGDADLDLGWTTRIRVNDLTVANADWAKARDPYMAEIGQLEVAIDVWELLKGHILIPEIDIARPRVDLEKNADGEANWQFAAAAKAAARGAEPEQRQEIPIIRQLNLDDGRLSYRDATIDRSATLSVNRLQVTDDRSDRKVQITGDGHYKIQVTREAGGQGGPFAIRFLGDNWEQLRDQLKGRILSTGRDARRLEG